MIIPVNCVEGLLDITTSSALSALRESESLMSHRKEGIA